MATILMINHQHSRKILFKKLLLQVVKISVMVAQIHIVCRGTFRMEKVAHIRCCNRCYGRVDTGNK